ICEDSRAGQRRHLGSRGRASHDAADRMRRSYRRTRVAWTSMVVSRARRCLRRLATLKPSGIWRGPGNHVPPRHDDDGVVWGAVGNRFVSTACILVHEGISYDRGIARRPYARGVARGFEAIVRVGRTRTTVPAFCDARDTRQDFRHAEEGLAAVGLPW